MLGKLLKYNLRSCFRHMWPFWLAMTAMAVINGLTTRLSIDGGSAGFLLHGLPILLLVISVFVTFFGTLIYVCTDFYNGLLGTPGYLMFTLPVKTSGLILSKCITAIILEILSILVACISAALLLTIITPAGLADTVRAFFRMWGKVDISGNVCLLLVELMIMFLTLAAAFNTKIYAASAVGQLFGKARLAISFVAYILLGILTSMIVTRAAALFSNSLPSISITFTSVSFDNFEESVTSSCKVAALVTLYNLAVGAIDYFISWLILDKKLNLE